MIQVDTVAAGDELVEGVLVCPACLREHPIIDGIVIAVANIRSWAEHQAEPVLRRHDLSPLVESLLGDTLGPGGSFDKERHDLSTYATAHWGDRALEQPIDPASAVAGLTATALATVPTAPRGLWLDVGCALGRSSFEVAAAGAELVVGVDLNMAMLRRAEAARRTGVARWPRRRIAQVYDPAEASLDDLPADRVGFVCADVLGLPLVDAAVDGALSLNVLDCVPSPVGHLYELGRVLRDGAPAVVTTPYDWSASATPIEHWIGGHSQRGDHGGAAEPEMRRLLSVDRAAGLDTGLTLVDERDDVPWHLQLGARATMQYRLHLLRLARAVRA